ncbi:hypothetical protein, partial [Halogeometricum sp. CBA1124]|uniref:hypothetical protein n=1 Tax=Halogeometricum sp. CBA1124 TaxID=2668071 RepID=UPI001E5E68ED
GDGRYIIRRRRPRSNSGWQRTAEKEGLESIADIARTEWRPPRQRPGEWTRTGTSDPPRAVASPATARERRHSNSV